MSGERRALWPALRPQCPCAGSLLWGSSRVSTMVAMLVAMLVTMLVAMLVPAMLVPAMSVPTRKAGSLRTTVMTPSLARR